MPKVEDVRVLNIDGVPYAVDGMSETVKQMVAVFNDWNQREADARSELQLVVSAKNDLSRQIIQQVRKEQEEAKKAQEGQQAAPVAPVPVPAPAAPAPAPVNVTEAPAEEPAEAPVEAANEAAE